MRICIVLLIIFLYWPAFSFQLFGFSQGKSGSGGDNRNQTKPEYRILKKIQLQTDRAWVIVREAGHILGQPFQVELRVACQSSEQGDGEEINVMKYPVKDSFSVCDLDPQSVRLNLDRTALALKVKLVDMDHYSDQTGKGVEDLEFQCSKTTTIKQFFLNDLCQNSKR